MNINQAITHIADNAKSGGPVGSRREADRIVQRLSDEVVRDWLAVQLAEKARGLRRERVLEIERTAMKEAVRQVAHSKAFDAEAFRERLRKEREERYARMQAKDAERRAAREEYYQSGEAKNITSQFFAEVNAAIDELKVHLRDEIVMEWTTELLESAITLSDGTVTTWGEASVLDHNDRIEMFDKNTKANLEGAVRHEYAVKVLVESGQPSLNSFVAQGGGVK